MTFTGSQGTDWTCGAITAVRIQCSTNTVIQAGASSSFVLDVAIAANAAATLTNTATVSGVDPNRDNDTGSVTFPVTANTPDLTLTKATAGGQLRQGGTVNFTLTVNNTGIRASSGAITVRDPLPAGLTLSGAASGTGWDCSGSSASAVVCTSSGEVRAGSSGQPIAFTAAIAAGASSSLTNIASVEGGGETNTSNNTGSVTFSISSNPPDLTLTKTANGTFAQGGNGSFSLTVTNAGTGASSGTITVNDNLPTGLTLSGFTGIGWTCSGSTQVACSSTAVINAGGTSTVTLNVAIAANAAASLTNTATVGGGGEANTGNNTGSVTFPVNAVAPDLTLTKSVSGDFVRGGTGLFVLTAGNSGGGSTSGSYTISDALPNGMALSGFSGNGWNCTGTTQVSCVSSAVLPPGGTSSVALTVSIPAAVPRTVTNRASISGGGETNTGNNQAEVSVPVLTPVTIRVPAGVAFSFDGKSYAGNRTLTVAPGSYGLAAVSPQTLGAGTRAVFVSWSNNGSLSQTLVVGETALEIMGTFGTEFQLTVNATAGGTATPTSGFHASGSVVNLMASANSGFTFANWTGDAVGGSTAASTTITMDGPKAVTANFATVTLTPDLAIEGIYGSNFVQGRISSFAARVRNAGGAASTGEYFVEYALPPGWTLGNPAPAGNGWVCGVPQTNLVRCTRSTVLLAGAVAPDITIFVTPATNAPATLLHQITVGGGGEVNSANNTASTSLVIERVVTITVPAGVAFSLNGVDYTGSQTVTLPAGSYPLTTTTPQMLNGGGTRAQFQSWSNLGSMSQTLSVGAGAIGVSANFGLQHQLMTAAGPGGTISPVSGQFFDAGSSVPVSAMPASGFVFGSWTGPVANAALASTTVTISGPVSVAATFTASGTLPAVNVTGQFTVTLGSVSTNRLTGRFVQNVTLRNNGAALPAAAFVLDALTPIYAVHEPAGRTSATAPSGSPYREIGPVGAGAAVTFTVEFTRTAVGTLTYTPRLLGAGAR